MPLARSSRRSFAPHVRLVCTRLKEVDESKADADMELCVEDLVAEAQQELLGDNGTSKAQV